MIYRRLFIIVLLLSITGTSLQSTEHFSSITNRHFGFSVRVPSRWKVKEVDLGYKYLVICTKDPFTEIVISATEQDLNTIEKWENWEEWYIEGKGYWLRRIVETKNLVLGNDMVAKLLLFEYQDKQKTVLDRVLISKFDERLIIIECKAPVSVYQRYSDIFTAVMGSLKKLEPAGD